MNETINLSDLISASNNGNSNAKAKFDNLRVATADGKTYCSVGVLKDGNHDVKIEDLTKLFAVAGLVLTNESAETKPVERLKIPGVK